MLIAVNREGIEHNVDVKVQNSHLCVTQSFGQHQYTKFRTQEALTLLIYKQDVVQKIKSSKGYIRQGEGCCLS